MALFLGVSCSMTHRAHHETLRVGADPFISALSTTRLPPSDSHAAPDRHAAAPSRHTLLPTDPVLLQGLPTIRSFRREDTLRARTGALVDTSSVMQLANQSLNRWLSLRLEAVGAVVSFAAAALAIEQKGQAAWAGLTLSYALQMTALTTMTVRSLPDPLLPHSRVTGLVSSL